MPLTVLQLLPELEVGGVEQGTLEIAEALVAAGHRALVVSAGGRMVEGLEAAGGEHHRLAVGRKHPSALLLIRKLRELCRAERVDVIHARSRLPAWIGYRARNGMPAEIRPRWITTVHGPYTVNRYSRIMVSGERVIAISDFIRDYIRISYPDIPATKITVIPRGVDRGRFAYGYQPSTTWMREWQARNPTLAGKRLLCLPARLTRWKGQLDFIQLIAQLCARNLPVHGLIVGGPHPHKREFEVELKDLVTRLGLGAHISFLGQRSDLREILAVSDFAFSLTREPEAFGRTTIEALSLGRPVVGYNHGGTGELLRAVFPVGLIPIGDIDAAAARVVDLLAHCPPVPAVHGYTLSRMQQATLAVYADLVQASD